MNYLSIQNIDCYKRSLELSNYVWNITIKWGWFEKTTLGSQYVRAIDSISANLAEGWGRYTKKDKINFFRYSYGSVKEATDWTNKAKVRNLITSDQYNHIIQELYLLPKEIHQIIQYINDRLKQ